MVASKKSKVSFKRILTLLASIAVILIISYWLWSPGEVVTDGKHDKGKNALWLQHGWLASDAWLKRNQKDPDQFRSAESIKALSDNLTKHGIKYVFPHACPCDFKGNISPMNHQQVEHFLDHIHPEIEIIPWIGGVNGTQCFLSNKQWRKTFVGSVKNLLEKHPRLSGVQLNIEPLDSGNTDFLLLLDEIRAVLPEGKTLSIAAYPPPTRWQPGLDIHWDEEYYKAVAVRVDQMVPMMYDTSIPIQKAYIKLMHDWTLEVLRWTENTDTEILLGIPAYEDQGVGYHDPDIENIETALKGIHSALSSYETTPDHYTGISVYAEWTMNQQKWQLLNDCFLVK